MLPSYFASTFHNRRVLVAMTFLFAAGVATVILPLAVGAAALRRAIFGHHTIVYLVGGTTLLGLGVYSLAGGRLRIPTPSRRESGSAGPLGVYSLGLFSGVASACCAPVLAGVVALSGVASSFVASLGLGLAYVFGMVAPLFGAALAWERYGERASTLFRPPSVTLRIGSQARIVSATGIASGVLLIAMGITAIWVGLRGQAMTATRGWGATLSSRLQHYGHVLTTWLDWVPTWVAGLALAAAVIALALRARTELLERRVASPDDDIEKELVP